MRLTDREGTQMMLMRETQCTICSNDIILDANSILPQHIHRAGFVIHDAQDHQTMNREI